MALEVDIAPLRALEIFYDGEKLGIPEEALVRAEQKRGLILPEKLREFLLNYGQLDVNLGGYRVLHPKTMDAVKIRLSDGELHDGWLIAETPHEYLAILKEDCDQDDPSLYLSSGPKETEDEEKWDFESSMWTVRRLLTSIFVNSPGAHGCTSICDDPKYMQQEVIKYDEMLDDSQKKLVDIFETAKRPDQCICWDSEEKKFVIVVLKPECDFLARFPIRTSIQELERIFAAEFLEKQSGIDYEHSLALIKDIAVFYEGDRSEKAKIKLGKYYKLAGFCCWKLKNLQGAEKWYSKAQKVLERNLKDALDDCLALYENLGKLSLEQGKSGASQQAFERVRQLRGFMETNEDPRKKGEQILDAAIKANMNGDYEVAIDLCNEALEELQKEPKGCKYDIARCQQIRGDARKKLKNS